MKFAPREVSRERVQVVLRESTSISPDCNAVKRSLADSGTNLILLGSSKIAAASARQISTSSPVQLPLSSGVREPRQALAHPAGQLASLLDDLEGLSRGGLGRKAGDESKGNSRDTRFMDKGLSVVSWKPAVGMGAFIATRGGQGPKSLPRAVLLGQHRDAGNGSKVAASPSTCSDKKRCCITERLAGRVKGLTARFDVLLVTILAVRPSRAARAKT